MPRKKQTEKELEPQVEIVSDEVTAEEPEIEVAAAEETKDDTGVAPEEGIEELRKKLEEERLARQEAEKRAREAQTAATKAANETGEHRISLVSSALDNLKREQDYLKANIKELMVVGDYDRAVEMQEAFQLNINKMVQLQNGLDEMKREPVKQVEQPQHDGPTVDDLIQRVTPRSAQWLERNRSHIQDSRTIRIMARAHEDAIDHGIIPESDAYFGFLENRLGLNKAQPRQEPRYEEQEPVMSAASAPTQRRSAPAAAPVSRSGSVGSSNSRTIRLTAEQVEAAKISGLTPKEYYDILQDERNRN